ncbi:MAG: zinc ribbon domain-containing protein [Thermodesulfobacteriaceae bacterium]|nr:zinc ribbon domain-containing protein [Thermodesulfobacteriaceae bacterium]
MAIYEYECLNCGYHFEVWQKITEDPLKICDKCGGELVRLIGQTGFILKGTGWYVTDYVRKEKKAQENSANNNTSQEKKA